MPCDGAAVKGGPACGAMPSQASAWRWAGSVPRGLGGCACAPVASIFDASLACTAAACAPPVPGRWCSPIGHLAWCVVPSHAGGSSSKTGTAKLPAPGRACAAASTGGCRARHRGHDAQPAGGGLWAWRFHALPGLTTAGDRAEGADGPVRDVAGASRGDACALRVHLGGLTPPSFIPPSIGIGTRTPGHSRAPERTTANPCCLPQSRP